ncbi:MAG: hypothetical protein ACXWWC_03640 [Chitinophagaceae bacterium]
MDATKIRLSPEEESLVIRADWILTKNSVIQKTIQLLASLQTQQECLLKSYKDFFTEEIINSSPKISKGENYHGLPYLILDHPKYFNKKNVFAIRMFFWWGNFFSGTLHLSGIYKTKYEEKILASFETLQTNGFYVCINEYQWEHHFEMTNYKPLSNVTAYQFEEMISNKTFIKLSKKISLEQWNDAEKNLLEIFSHLIKTMSD